MGRGITHFSWMWMQKKGQMQEFEFKGTVRSWWRCGGINHSSSKFIFTFQSGCFELEKNDLVKFRKRSHGLD